MSVERPDARIQSVLNDIPGGTSLIEHKIDVGNAKPIHWAQREAVKRELKMMEHRVCNQMSTASCHGHQGRFPSSLYMRRL